MRIQWHGQSAFLIAGDQPVFIDPLGRWMVCAPRGASAGLAARVGALFVGRSLGQR